MKHLVHGTRVGDEKYRHEKSWKNSDNGGSEGFLEYSIQLDLRIQGVRP